MADELGAEDTTGSLARRAGVTTATVRLYAENGWLEFRRLPDGTRIFSPGQEGRVRELCEQRMRSRGRRQAG